MAKITDLKSKPVRKVAPANFEGLANEIMRPAQYKTAQFREGDRVYTNDANGVGTIVAVSVTYIVELEKSGFSKKVTLERKAFGENLLRSAK